jgi:hypothetical protein
MGEQRPSPHPRNTPAPHWTAGPVRDADQVSVGRLRPRHELSRSALLPRPTIAVESILRVLETAEQLCGEEHSLPAYCGCLAAALDGYRAGLRELGK